MSTSTDIAGVVPFLFSFFTVAHYEIDAWLDILRGNARANFGYALNRSDPSLHEANVAEVVLSTERDPAAEDGPARAG